MTRVTMRGRSGSSNAFDPLNRSAKVFLRWLRCDDPHGDGNRLLPLWRALRAVVGMDAVGWLGGHGVIVGRSPDMKSRRGGGMIL